jgi:hypothetical protein
LGGWEPKQFPSTPKQHGKSLLPSPTPKQKTPKTTQTKNITQNTNKKISWAHKNTFNNNQKEKKTKTRSLALIEAAKTMKQSGCTIITCDYENEESVDGVQIKFVSFWIWAL